MSSTDENLREQIATIQHDQWSGWMRYMWLKCDLLVDGSRVIPRDCVERWTRQMQTPYGELTASEQKSDRVEVDKILQLLRSGNASDGYHTHNELYEFRKLYNAALFNEWSAKKKYNVHKSRKHSDGEECFGGGWFVVSATLPTGQISNHYELEDWGLFKCEERERADVWDGHTAQDVINRLSEFLTTVTSVTTHRLEYAQEKSGMWFTVVNPTCQKHIDQVDSFDTKECGELAVMEITDLKTCEAVYLCGTHAIEISNNKKIGVRR